MSMRKKKEKEDKKKIVFSYSSVPNNRVTPINRVKWELKDDMVACKKQMFSINV